MKVFIRQFEYDTDQMTAFSTGISSMPAIFVNDNGAAFLQISRRHWEAPKFRHLPRSEAFRLAESCRIPGLKEFVRARSAAVSGVAEGAMVSA